MLGRSAKPSEETAIWFPVERTLRDSNLARLVRRLGIEEYDQLLALSRSDPERIWRATLKDLDIDLDLEHRRFVDNARGKAWTRFFPDSLFNCAEAALKSPAIANVPALFWENEKGDTLTWSYDELRAQVRSIAAGLLARDLQSGERVGILLPNVPEAVVAFLAVSLVGAIAVPLYSGFGPEPAIQRLQDSGATWLVTADGFVRHGRIVSMRDTVAAIADRLGGSLRIIEVATIGEPLSMPGVLSWSDLPSTEKILPASTNAADPCMILYTSGTTGKPKGVVHCHGGFPLRIAQDMAYAFDFAAGDRLFWLSDMGWMVGPLSIFGPLILKGTLVLYDGAPDFPTIGRLRAIAARHNVTHFGSAPTVIRAMQLHEAESINLAVPSLKTLITAGEAIDRDAFVWYFAKFGNGRLPVINYTGGTEISGAILTNVVMRPIVPGKFNSTGLGMSVAILNNDGLPVVQEEGELCILQPFVGMAQGFWEDPDRYLDSYWTRFADVWVHGDLAIEDADGQFRLLGRSDDVMKIAGRRVGPSEIEAVACQSPSIAEAMATGVPDANSGEALLLFVRAVEEDATQAELSAAAASQIVKAMGKPYRPKAVVAVRRLPKTRNGKPMRRLLRQAWLNQPAGNVAGAEDGSIFAELVEACSIVQRR